MVKKITHPVMNIGGLYDMVVNGMTSAFNNTQLKVPFLNQRTYLCGHSPFVLFLDQLCRDVFSFSPGGGAEDEAIKE